MKQKYKVLKAFRVGRDQCWVKPDDTVELLPVQAHYPIQMGWLLLEVDKPSTDNTTAKETSNAGK